MLRLRTLGLLAASTALPAIILGSAAAAGPNLITNGNFSAGASGWSAWGGVPGTIAANPDQTLSVMNLSGPTITSMAGAVQCVGGVTPGTAYTLKADAFVPAGQQRHGGAETRLFWHSGASCSGPLLTSPFGSQFVTTTDAWVPTQTTFVAPAGTASVLVMLATHQYAADPGENPAAHLVTKWDNVSFAGPGVVIDTPPVLPPTVTVPGLPTIPPGITPVVPPTATAATPSNTPSQTATPTGTPPTTTTVTQQPVLTATPTLPSATENPVTVSTPEAPLPRTDAPLPPNTGSGNLAGRGALPGFEILLAAIGLVALGGLILSTASAVKKQ